MKTLPSPHNATDLLAIIEALTETMTAAKIQETIGYPIKNFATMINYLHKQGMIIKSKNKAKQRSTNLWIPLPTNEREETIEYLLAASINEGVHKFSNEDFWKEWISGKNQYDSTELNL